MAGNEWSDDQLFHHTSGATVNLPDITAVIPFVFSHTVTDQTWICSSRRWFIRILDSIPTRWRGSHTRLSIYFEQHHRSVPSLETVKQQCKYKQTTFMALASAKSGYIPNVAASCYHNCGLVLGRLLLLNVCNIFKGDFGDFMYVYLNRYAIASSLSFCLHS